MFLDWAKFASLGYLEIFSEPPLWAFCSWVGKTNYLLHWEYEERERGKETEMKLLPTVSFSELGYVDAIMGVINVQLPPLWARCSRTWYLC